MTYMEWYQAHGEKHKVIMDKLTHLSNEEIVAYFRFDNMVEKEADFCLLYKENKKCHDVEHLNCYLCACPHFRFDDEGWEMKGAKYLSSCSINSKEGGEFVTDAGIHQDCSNCLVPHNESYIRRNFSRDWFEIMEDVLP
ncbi:MAG: FIG00388424: hypothetical protein [uncultured Sulfurovum sp.]|uniref:Cysteine-rich small domain-containing protein n=1 Tax=uncultured Sulfurovum sp. TaxID=269237 RepID=A0A6S6U265_9BACT|nr:MAG: FIG00388424: hypothetical protein [uncultured Sulfurovum sp.]